MTALDAASREEVEGVFAAQIGEEDDHSATALLDHEAADRVAEVGGFARRFVVVEMVEEAGHPVGAFHGWEPARVAPKAHHADRIALA